MAGSLQVSGSDWVEEGRAREPSICSLGLERRIQIHGSSRDPWQCRPCAAKVWSSVSGISRNMKLNQRSSSRQQAAAATTTAAVAVAMVVVVVAERERQSEEDRLLGCPSHLSSAFISYHNLVYFPLSGMPGFREVLASKRAQGSSSGGLAA